MTWSLIFEHLYIVLLAALFSLLIGLPLGVLSYLSAPLRRPILWVADLLQTIPSLALLGIIMVFLGAGKPTVVCGITLYSLLPIVRNTCLGLQEVPPGLKEAARGCGMSRMGQLFLVEIPNALPMILPASASPWSAPSAQPSLPRSWAAAAWAPLSTKESVPGICPASWCQPRP